ncbi:DsbA family protein [Undibacterium sp. CY18W]|uniref:DsbA family protein n=1 Tax=Undibacterium hunanense TaxID=2762292 RepID=A0ABR6ZSE1_9BURK|nr:DsbA family protein [Undibacterium hunanense]MBC3918823.1 DsbA family protein [Undibacterium hunanense]
MEARLHIVFDPLCGWCYAASPFLRQSQTHFSERLSMVFHPGLLFPEINVIPAAYREHIISADQHIAKLSGVLFGSAYLSKVKNTASLSYYSVPAATAVSGVAALAAVGEIAADAGLGMLEKIQHAHYVDAADVNDLWLLSQLAAGLDVTAEMFKDCYAKAQADLPGQTRLAHQLLRQVGAQGFPTFILEANGQFLRLDHSAAYQDGRLFVEQIEQALVSRNTA